MPILITCANCSTRMKAPDSAAGKKVKCPKCATLVIVPFSEDERAAGAEERIASERPAEAPAPRRTRPDEIDEGPPRPRKSASRHEDEDEDQDRPRRRKKDDEEDRPRSRHQEEDEDRPRRRHQEEDEDEDEDRPRRRKQAEAKSGSTGPQLALGISALVVGGIGLLFNFIPCIGWFVSLPAGVLGLLLGGIGLIIAAVRGWRGLVMPITGSAVSVLTLVGAVLWITLLGTAIHKGKEAADKEMKEAADKRREALNKERERFEKKQKEVEQPHKDKEIKEKPEEKAPVVKIGDFEQHGTLRAQKRDEVGIVYFALPYAAPPRLTFGSTWFVTTEVTPRYFRWRHTDNTPSDDNWKATGEVAANLELPFARSGSLSAQRLNEEGVVRFPIAYASPPNVELPSRFFQVVDVSATEFRWRHLDKTRSTANWTARGMRSPAAPVPPMEQTGKFKAKNQNETGLVRFPLAYAASPTLTVTPGVFFKVLEVTATHFRWQHLDNTPTEGVWKATGPRPPDALEHTGVVTARNLNEAGLFKFLIPYASPPNVELNNTYFEVTEVTTTHFRWRHKDKTPSTADWTARGARGKHK
jgi:hypothetical protein